MSNRSIIVAAFFVIAFLATTLAAWSQEPKPISSNAESGEIGEGEAPAEPQKPRVALILRGSAGASPSRLLILRGSAGASPSRLLILRGSAGASPSRLANSKTYSKFITNSIGMKLARIPAGSFMMGSPGAEAERTANERLHKVTLTKPFYMGAFEVTQQQYVQVMNGLENFRNRSAFKGNDLPAENVEWRLAKVFCERLSARPAEKNAGRKYRLPTEAEWEYACRAGAKTAFHFGNSLSSKQANFNGKYPAGGAAKGTYLRKTTKVGAYKPNAFGLYDMHGNVAEWCADWYDPKYYQLSPGKDPQGPPKGVVPTKFTNLKGKNFFVVVRGGCWVDDGRACRSAYRFRAMPNTQYRIIGFRVVCDVAGE